MASPNTTSSKAPQLLILMKGHPCTGKSTVSRSLASRLHIPLLDKDDIRDSTVPLQHHPHSIPPSLLNALSHEILLNLIKTQLYLGISLIVDSTLSRKSYFDRMAEIAHDVGTKVVVIECRPSDMDEWRRRVEERKSWHKPCTWKDMESLIEGYNGCYEYDVEGVPKLVVDTTKGDEVEDVVSCVLQFLAANRC